MTQAQFAAAQLVWILMRFQESQQQPASIVASIHPFSWTPRKRPYSGTARSSREPMPLTGPFWVDRMLGVPGGACCAPT